MASGLTLALDTIVLGCSSGYPRHRFMRHIDKQSDLAVRGAPVFVLRDKA